MKKLYFCFAIFIYFLFSNYLFAQQNKLINNVNEAKIDSILSLMTTEEKCGQLIQFSINWWDNYGICSIKPEHKELIKKGLIGSFLNVFGADFSEELQKTAVTESRLKIPLLFAFDVIHGFKTIFPVPLAEASSWDMNNIFNSSKYQAIEAASNGIHWTFNPMVDIARDPRWGRIVEGAGEDPYLGSQIAIQRIKGYQGDDFNSPFSIIACPKHFAAYGAAEGGRDYNSVDISLRTLYNVYLPPFFAAIYQGAGSIMCSFNEISGIPSSANKQLLSDILKDEQGFKGLVVSDWNSIGELMQHGIAKDESEAALLSIKAGVDIDMESSIYFNQLAKLVHDGIINSSLLDEAVKRVLRIKFILGLFDNPYKYCNKDNETKNTLSKESINAAYESAKRSIVLLKNNNNLLPFKKNYKSIAVIGPLANSKRNPLGSWEQLGDSNNVITLLEGIKNKVSDNTKIYFTEGCSISGNSEKGFDDAIQLAKDCDYVILALGEDAKMSGESRCRSDINLPGGQEKLAKEIYKINKNVVVILMNGRPLTISWLDENIPSILETWFLGLQTGNAIADVIFGDYNPSGKLPITFPRSVGQIPIYYNHKNGGRPANEDLKNLSSRYLDLPITPLYPFGYGLSYSKFTYTNLLLNKSQFGFKDSIIISVDVTNESNIDGEEVIQLYIQDINSSVTRPVKELKGFNKVYIPANTTVSVSFSLSSENLAFYSINNKMESEPGFFNVYVGGNSMDLLNSKFELLKD